MAATEKLQQLASLVRVEREGDDWFDDLLDCHGILLPAQVNWELVPIFLLLAEHNPKTKNFEVFSVDLMHRWKILSHSAKVDSRDHNNEIILTVNSDYTRLINGIYLWRNFMKSFLDTSVAAIPYHFSDKKLNASQVQKFGWLEFGNVLVDILVTHESLWSMQVETESLASANSLKLLLVKEAIIALIIMEMIYFEFSSLNEQEHAQTVCIIPVSNKLLKCLLMISIRYFERAAIDIDDVLDENTAAKHDTVLLKSSIDIAVRIAVQTITYPIQLAMGLLFSNGETTVAPTETYSIGVASLLLYLVLIQRSDVKTLVNLMGDIDVRKQIEIAESIMTVNRTELPPGDGSDEDSLISFNELFGLMKNNLQKKPVLLLFYSLLRLNRNFYYYIVTKNEIDQIASRLGLMLSGKEEQWQVVSVVVLLMLSSDVLFSSAAASASIDSSGCTLADSLCLSLLSLLSSSLSPYKNPFLQMSILGTLSNLLIQITNISMTLAMKIMSLLDVLGRKYTVLTQKSKLTETEEEFYLSIFRVLLESINVILCNSIKQNPNLIYGILHAEHMFQRFNLKFPELLANIQILVDYYGPIVREANEQKSEISVESVLEVLCDTVSRSRLEWSVKYRKDDVRYEYMASDSEDLFFRPLLFKLVTVLFRESCASHQKVVEI